MCVPDTRGGQKRDPLELKLQICCELPCGTELWSSTRTASALNSRASFQPVIAMLSDLLRLISFTYLFRNKVSRSSGWPWIYYLTEDDLELWIFLILPLKCWDFWLLHLANFVFCFSFSFETRSLCGPGWSCQPLCLVSTGIIHMSYHVWIPKVLHAQLRNLGNYTGTAITSYCP